MPSNMGHIRLTGQIIILWKYPCMDTHTVQMPWKLANGRSVGTMVCSCIIPGLVIQVLNEPVLLPFEISIPTAFTIVSNLQSDRFAWYQRLSVADSISWISYGHVQWQSNLHETNGCEWNGGLKGFFTDTRVQGGHCHTSAITFYNLNNGKVSPNWLLGI